MANRKTYSKTGKCIWCGRKAPYVSFETAPHILPQSLGGNEIGTDICDDCNHYFGTATIGKPSIDITYKEIFNAFRVFSENLSANSHKKLSSIFFTYRHSKKRIYIKPNFRAHIITRQFKRSLFNVFLQKYHSVTGNGNHEMFDMVRKFARYDIGNPKVFYAFNNILLTTNDKDNPSLIICDNTIDEMFHSGLFSFWFLGHWFYLEIFPTAFNVNGKSYLRKQAETILLPAKGNECIFELTNIMQIDFLMQRFNS